MAMCKTLLNEVIDARFHGSADFGPKPSATERRILRKKLPVEPGRARRFHLRCDREIGPGSERQTTAAIRIIVGSCLNDGAAGCIARHLEIAEAQVMRTAIDACHDRIGSTFQ